MQQRSSAVTGEPSQAYARLKAAPLEPKAGAPMAGGGAIARLLQAHLGFLFIFIQVVLVALLLRELDIQTSAFRRVMYLSTLGFIINHYLPATWRLRFFAAFSLLAVAIVMGGSGERFLDIGAGTLRGGALLLLGLVLIGICLLKINFWARACLLGGVGIIAAIFRSGWLPSGTLAVIWPILAALFMFRVMIYLYDVSNSPQRPALSQSLSYFFLIPNVCCTLFPVIDFKTFTRSHYSEPALLIYQRGVRWMARGIIQLLIYRFIDQLASIKANEVTNGTDLIQFLIVNSFLYLKVSGQFHLFIGMLLLFGFNLPETNHRYFLASSFTDYWRRVNIYWKDFMMKVFYYPAFFRLKHLGQTQAMVYATLWAFFITWVLHLYQTWWLKGSASVSWPDTLFWLILAVLVLGNSLWEMKKGRQRKLATSTYTAAEAVSIALRTGLTFAIVSTLWSLWSSDSFGLWLHIWSLADRYTLVWGGAILLTVMLAKLVIEILPEMKTKPVATARKLGPPPAVPMFRWETAHCLASLTLVFIVAHPFIQKQLDQPALQPYRDALASGDSLVGNGLSRERGYYERLTNVDEANRQLWETLMARKIDNGYQGVDPVRPVKDFRFRELLPSVQMAAYMTEIQTNRWGMVDRDYEQAKAPGTFRIALLGSSNEMGWGVPTDTRFESLIEKSLVEKGAKVETLNFSVRAYSPMAQISVMQNKAAAFNPDVVIFMAHLVDYEWLNRDLYRCLSEYVPVPDELQSILDEARIVRRTNEALASDRIRPFEPKLVRWSYGRIVEEARRAGATPVCVYMPLPYELPLNLKQVEKVLAIARDAGFVVVDMSQIFDGRPIEELMLNEPWRHCSVTAHSIVAAELEKRLLTDPRINLATRFGLSSPLVSTGKSAAPTTQALQ